jgi:hypothetical protein
MTADLNGLPHNGTLSARVVNCRQSADVEKVTDCGTEAESCCSIKKQPEVWYHFHKNPPLYRILSQINPLHGSPCLSFVLILFSCLPLPEDERS